jgi:hypothetical protein
MKNGKEAKVKNLEVLLETIEKMEAIVTELNNSVGTNLRLLHSIHTLFEDDGCYMRDFVFALHQSLFIDLSLWKDEFSTPEICKKAAQWFGEFAIPYVPKKFLSAELYMLALRRVPHSEYFFREIPRKFKTPELCLAAVRQNQFELQYVPEPLKTLELCVAAIKESGDWDDKEETAIDFVPPEMVEQVLEVVREAEMDDIL